MRYPSLLFSARKSAAFHSPGSAARGSGSSTRKQRNSLARVAE
jgi:hypothetical protein